MNTYLKTTEEQQRESKPGCRGGFNFGYFNYAAAPRAGGKHDHNQTVRNQLNWRMSLYMYSHAHLLI